MNIVGNINGGYKAPQIDLFEIAKKRGVEQQPVKTVSSILGKDTALKVNISKEGLQALRGSKLHEGSDLSSRIAQMEYISEHQPIENFSDRLGRELRDSYANVTYEKRPSIEDKGNTLLNSLKKMADEIVAGNADGSRVRFIEDATASDGYRRLSMEDELSILQDEFDEFVEGRFGKKHQEDSAKVVSALNEFQKIKQQNGLGATRVYEPEKISDKFIEDLLKAGRTYISSLMK